jgi:outer membrane protein assembly factor BamB
MDALWGPESKSRRGTFLAIFAIRRKLVEGALRHLPESSKQTEMWSNSNAGTSPVIAGGLLYVYNPQGGLYVYDPVRGTQLAKLETGNGHWNSPIVVDGKIALPEGNANEHATAGVLDIWTLAGNAPRRPRRPGSVRR